MKDLLERIDLKLDRLTNLVQEGNEIRRQALEVEKDKHSVVERKLKLQEDKLKLRKVREDRLERRRV